MNGYQIEKPRCQEKIQQYGVEGGSQGQVTLKERVDHSVTCYLYFNKSVKGTNEVNHKKIIVNLTFQ